MYGRGQIVFLETGRDSKGEPTGMRLWVWESMYDPLFQSMSYSLKDGPGENANFMGWASEEDLEEWIPAWEDEFLIDFDLLDE